MPHVKAGVAVDLHSSQRLAQARGGHGPPPITIADTRPGAAASFDRHPHSPHRTLRPKSSGPRSQPGAPVVTEIDGAAAAHAGRQHDRRARRRGPADGRRQVFQPRIIGHRIGIAPIELDVFALGAARPTRPCWHAWPSTHPASPTHMPCLRHRPATVATAAFGGGVPMIVDLGDASYPPPLWPGNQWQQKEKQGAASFSKRRARMIVAAWRGAFNAAPPHPSLGDWAAVPPASAHATQMCKSRPMMPATGG